MRPIVVLLCLSAAIVLAQTKPPQETAATKAYPVWWIPELNLAKLEDVEARLAQPFSEEDLNVLKLNAESFSQPAQLEVHNCNELLAVVDPNKWDFWSLDRVGSWGNIGSDCAIVKELGHATPARRSAVRNMAWTPALFSLLPAGICYADGEKSHAAAMEADKQGLSLHQYSKGKAGTQRLRGSGRIILTLDNRFAGASYDLVARGDFDGDGWEDIVIEVIGVPPHSGRGTVAVYVLTRKSDNSRFQTIKAIF